jgi:hypothetical protein
VKYIAVNAENVWRYEESIGVPWSAFQPSHLFIIRGVIRWWYSLFCRAVLQELFKQWHACSVKL